MSGCEENEKKCKKFSKKWIDDDRYKGWIREVPSDNSKFHCIYCDDIFSCSSSHVDRHAKSKSHLTAVESGSKKKFNEKKFLRKWLEFDEFKPWLQEIPKEPFRFKCTVCDVSCSSGLTQIRRHKESISHRKACLEKNIPIIVDTSQSERVSMSIDEETSAAEIRYAALMSEERIPFMTGGKILKFFQELSKNPLILQNMTMGRTKASKIVANVLSPVNTERVVNSLQNNKFTLFIDESSDNCNKKWMDIITRYVNENNLNVHIELLTLLNIDASDCSADRIFQAIKCEFYHKQIPLRNVIALACDNASVMMGHSSSVMTKLKDSCGGKLIAFPCPCHSVALVAQVACAKLPTDVEELYKKIPNFLNNSNKRAAIFEDFQDAFSIESHKIRKFCETRWLSRHGTGETILENWDALVHFLRELFVNDKSKAAGELLEKMTEPGMKAFFLFLDYALELFNKYNIFFQSTQTRIHLLHTKSQDLLKVIMNNFMIPSVLEQSDLSKIDFHKNTNHKNFIDIFIGAAAEDYLYNIQITEEVNVSEIVKGHCLNFYIAAAEKIRQRLPIADEFLSKLSVLDAKIALFDPVRVESFEKLSFIAKHFDNFDEEGLKIEWISLFQDLSFIEKKALSACSFDEMWKRISLIEQQGTIKYIHLRRLSSLVRSLPNSNADSERCFSHLTDLKTKKRNRLCAASVSSHCVVKSGLKATGDTPETMAINASHLSLMKSDNLYKNLGAKRQKLSLNIRAHEDDGMNNS